MTVKTMPRPIADAIADFVSGRVQATGHHADTKEQERRASYRAFVAHYERAVRDRHEVTADNLAHALLEIAVHHQDVPGFKAAWREWQQVGPALEGESAQ